VTKFASDLPDYPDLLGATAKHAKLPDTIVEKDYFVVRALRGLCEQIQGQFLFKGGTSLSKGWNLLQRFSEDIDLLFRVEDGKGGWISKGEVDRRLEGAERIVAATPGFKLLSQTRSKGIRRCSDFEYPRVAKALVPIGRKVRLEMGTRGGTHPSSIRTIRSYITEFVEATGQTGLAEDLVPFETECLDVARTTLEKLFAVHAAFEKDRAKGCTRHYYDLFQCFGLEEVGTFLTSSEYAGVYADIEGYSRDNWPEAALPPDGKFSNSGAFQPNREDLAVLREHYKQERDLFFVEPPSIEEILHKLKTTIDSLKL